MSFKEDLESIHPGPEYSKIRTEFEKQFFDPINHELLEYVSWLESQVLKLRTVDKPVMQEKAEESPSKVPPYRYYVRVWGGFFNQGNKRRHRIEEGDYWFSSLQEQNDFLEQCEKSRLLLDIPAYQFCCVKKEGFATQTKTVLHRVIEFEGKQSYSLKELWPDYPFEDAKYYLQNRWCPGSNDYPLGRDFDYEKNKVKVVQEWITGAFDIKDEE